MKKFCLAALLAALLLIPCGARAGDSGFYVAPKFVTGFQGTDWKLSTPSGSGSHDSTRGIAGFSVAAGCDLSVQQGLPLRAELEYGYNSRVSKSVGGGTANARIQTLMVNGYWDITNIMDFTPYVGAGIGFAAIRTQGNTDTAWGHYSASDTDYNLAAQVGLGCSYYFTPNVSADLGYRYLFTGDCDTGYSGFSVKGDSVHMHQLSLGLRFSF